MSPLAEQAMATSKAKTPTATNTQLPVQKQDKKSNSGPSYCAYHDPILNLRPPSAVEQPRRYSIMDRILQEGPADQSAIFNRPDNGVVSISKGCTCLKNGEKKAGRL